MPSIVKSPIALVGAVLAAAALAVVGWQVSARSTTSKPHEVRSSAPAEAVTPTAPAAPKPVAHKKTVRKHAPPKKHHAAAKHAAPKHAAASHPKKPAATKPQTAAPKPAPAKPAPHKHATAPKPVKTHPITVAANTAKVTAGGITFTFSATGHQPVAGQPWSTTVSAKRAGAPVTGSVSYDALLSGQVVGGLASHKLENGSFTYPYRFPAAAAAANVPVVIRATVKAGGLEQIFNYTIQVKAG